MSNQTWTIHRATDGSVKLKLWRGDACATLLLVDGMFCEVDELQTFDGEVIVCPDVDELWIGMQ